jgi:hypothetical protein
VVKNIKKFFSLLSIMDYILSLNNSKFVAGITMLVVNLGSKYLAQELSDSQEALFTNVVIRRFVIFTVVFMATKDLLISLVLTAVFIVLVSGLFNENSKYCIIKKRRKKKINKKEYQEAKKIIQLYELQKLNE